MRSAACFIAGVALVTGVISSVPAWALAHGGFAGSSGTAGAPGPVTATTQPSGFLPGIDVSHYQGTIDWTQVAAAGIRFAFAKATDGRTFVDPTYAVNRIGANAAGIVLGAYHFARPDGSLNDAILEADHFVDVAQPAPGDLLPVLDVERTGGLSSTELTNWILAWLGEVVTRTGVRPIVYTSPIGWRDRTGDTTTIADAGFTVLWIAHWNVASPTLPANDWQGNGWTFWQYGDCGSVPGITGCVDSDWYNGLAFDPVLVAGSDLVAPTATFTPPTGVAGATAVSFSEPVRQVDDASVVLQAVDAGIVATTFVCDGPKGAEVDCVTGKVATVTIQPTQPLVPGEAYAAIVNPAGAAPPVVDLAGNAASTAEQDFVAPTEIEQGSPAVRYDWRIVFSPKAYGRSYAVENLAGARASFAFAGRTVTWFTATGPQFGKAFVSIDGRARGTFDQYASATQLRVGRTFRHLAPGPHTLAVVVLAQKGSPSGTDSQVAVDAFQAGGHIEATPDATYSWRAARVPGSSGGSVMMSELAHASATFVFHGTGVDWHTTKGPDQGRAQVYLDGALVRTFDSYATGATPVTLQFEGLAEGLHTLRIVVAGESRPASTSTRVSVDGFTVVP